MTTGNSWKTETRSAAKRILIGVVTAVVTTAVIYFLGFDRPGRKANEAEIRKNSIRTWKDFVKLENALQPRHDSVFAKVVRSDISVEESQRLDSLISTEFVDSLTQLIETPDIDKDLRLIIESRIQFKNDELARAARYRKQFVHLRDTITSEAYRIFLLDELNKDFYVKRDNAIERMGHTLEDLLAVLEKKHKYPFKLRDLSWYPRFLELRTVRREENRPDDGPPPM